MSVNEQLTDQERVELTKKSYENLQLGESITIDQHHLGIVCRVECAEDGMRCLLYTSPSPRD